MCDFVLFLDCRYHEFGMGSIWWVERRPFCAMRIGYRHSHTIALSPTICTESCQCNPYWQMPGQGCNKWKRQNTHLRGRKNGRANAWLYDHNPHFSHHWVTYWYFRYDSHCRWVERRGPWKKHNLQQNCHCFVRHCMWVLCIMNVYSFHQFDCRIMLFQCVHYLIFSILVVFLLIPAIIYPLNFNSDVSEGKIILKYFDIMVRL